MQKSIRQEKEVSYSFLPIIRIFFIARLLLYHNGMCVSPSHSSQTALQLLGKNTHEKQDTKVALRKQLKEKEDGQSQSTDTVTGDI